jgi:hypothetical protein
MIMMPENWLLWGFMEYIGNVVEMGDLQGERGICVQMRSDAMILITGFYQHEMMKMPNLLYRKVKISIEIISDSEE